MAKETIKKAPVKAVYVIRESGERTSWTRVGVAFVNRDGSLNLHLHAVPVDGKLHVRDFARKAAS